MAPTGAQFHFWLSLYSALGAAAAWWLLRRPRSDSLLAPISGFCAAMAVGIVKEVRDLLTNPWSLLPLELRADAAADMAWNFAGAIAGGFISALAVAIGAFASHCGLTVVSGRACTKGPPAHRGQGSRGTTLLPRIAENRG